MISIAIFFAYIFSSQDFTCINNAFDFTKVGDSVFVATSGGVAKFRDGDFQISGDTAKFSFTIFTASKGLRSHKIKSITSDQEGNIWVVVQDQGIHVKPQDGDKFLYYSLPLLTLNRSKVIRFFPPDYLLVGTDFGLFVIKTGGNLDPVDDRIYPPLLVRDTVISISTTDSFALVSTPSNIYGWTPDSAWIFNLPLNYGRFGFVAISHGIILYNSGTRIIFYGPAIVREFNLNNVYYIAAQSDTFYIASAQGVFKLFEGVLLRVTPQYSGMVIPLNTGILITSYAVNRENVSYGPSWSLLVDGRRFVVKTSIPFNLITSMAYKRGLLACGILAWSSDTFALESKGFILKDSSLYFLDSLITADHAVRTIAIDDSLRIWVGTYSANAQGIYIFDSTGKFVSKIEGLPGSIVTHISIGRDTVVALWQQGIYRIHKFEDGFIAQEIFRVDYPFVVTHGNSGYYLVGTENEGFIKIDSFGHVVLRITPADLNSPLVSMAKEKGNKIYIGAPSGFFVYSGGNLRLLSRGIVRDFEFYKDYTVVLQDSSILVFKEDSLLLSLNSENSSKTNIGQQFYVVRDILELTEDGTIVAGGEEGITIINVLFPQQSQNSVRVFPNPCRKGEKIFVESQETPMVFDLSFKHLNYKPSKIQDLYCFDTSGWDAGFYLIVVPGKKPVTVIIKN
ncbi:MAG: hypothetical protein ACPLN0_01270 [Candidatus Hydrothermia bacterium]